MENPLKFEDKDSVNILAKQHQEDEAIIAKGLLSFFEVGFALLRIRDSKSYKEVDGYKTFDAYCRDKWDIGKAYTYYLIGSAKVVENLSTKVDVLPTTETQCRPLIYLKPKEQCEVWEMVLNSGQKITAKLVQESLNEFKKPDPEEVEELRRQASEAMGESFEFGGESAEDPNYGYEGKRKREKTVEQLFKEFREDLEKLRKINAEINAGYQGKFYMAGESIKWSPKTKKLCLEMIQIGHRGIAKKYHPDVAGGSTEDMTTINNLNDFLMGYVTELCG